MKIDETMIGNNGIEDLAAGQVDERQVEACDAFIYQYILPRKTIAKKWGSYQLKHRVEDWLQEGGDGVRYREQGIGYIGNGAFIVAALRRGYKVMPDGRNAYFNMDFRLLDEVLRDKEKQKRWK